MELAPVTKCRLPGGVMLLLSLSLYLSAAAGAHNITAARDNVSNVTLTPDTPTTSATPSPPTPNATSTPPAWRTAPATPAPTPTKQPARHLMAAAVSTKPRHGSKRQLLQAAHKVAGVQRNKAPVPTPMVGAATPTPAHEVAAGLNRPAEPQPSNTTGVASNTTTDASITLDISHAANTTLNHTSAVAASTAGNQTAGTDTTSDLRYMYDDRSPAAVASNTARRNPSLSDDQLYLACSSTVAAVSIQTVRRMLPGGGKSGGRRLRGHGLGSHWGLFEYIYQLHLFYSGGASSSSARPVHTDAVPSLVVHPAASGSIPNSTRRAAAAGAVSAAATGAAAAAAVRSGAVGGSNETPAAPAAADVAAAAMANHTAANQTAVPTPQAAAPAGALKTTTTTLPDTNSPSRAGATLHNPSRLPGAGQDRPRAKPVPGLEGVWSMVPLGSRCGGKHKRALLLQSSPADATARRLLPGGGRQETANVPSGYRTAAASHNSKRPPMPRGRLTAPAAGAGALPHTGSSKP